jgi:hypothetical protein
MLGTLLFREGFSIHLYLIIAEFKYLLKLDVGGSGLLD